MKRCTGWVKRREEEEEEGHETLYWVCGTHADGSTEIFGGAPYGATKRCTGLPERIRTVALGPS
eukprot:5745093-Pyramimonas_sp.AAC.1